jgi:hypothetical protein
MRLYRVFLIALLILLPVSDASAWSSRGAAVTGPLWDPITYFGTDLAIWFDAVDTSTVTTSAGLVTNWNSKVGSAAAVPFGTAGPAWSLTARNGLPGLTFSNVEMMSFSAAGLATGNSPSTIVAVGYAVTDTNGKFFASYGADRYPWIVKAALKNRQKQFVIDGEAVILGVDGIPDFNALHSHKHDHEVQLYAFDILALDGEDLRGLPLSMRKTNLARLLARRPDGIFVAPHGTGRDRSRPVSRRLSLGP